MRAPSAPKPSHAGYAGFAGAIVVNSDPEMTDNRL
jgi:hypothetical protein